MEMRLIPRALQKAAIKIDLKTCDTMIMFQRVSNLKKMEIDKNSEKVAILDAGAQYGKVGLKYKILWTNCLISISRLLLVPIEIC